MISYDNLNRLLLLIGKSVYSRKVIYITGLQNRICKSGMINAVGHFLSFEADRAVFALSNSVFKREVLGINHI